MSAAASSSNPVKASTEGAQEPIKDANAPPTLGVLEEDDEFEEFPVQDWDDSRTDAAHLAGAAPGAAQSGGNKLWEDNWDDDDVEDDFNVQLRAELAKTGKGSGGSDAMQT